MRFDIMTLFPEVVETVLSSSIIGRAQNSGFVEIHTHNIRSYSKDKRHRVDDTPYGGGMGMLMGPEPIYECYSAILKMQEEQAAETSASSEGETCVSDGTPVSFEGETCVSDGTPVSSEGKTCVSDGTSASSEGETCVSDGTSASPEGKTCVSDGTSASSEGKTCVSDGTPASPEGKTCVSDGTSASSEGETCVSDGVSASSECEPAGNPTDTPVKKPIRRRVIYMSPRGKVLTQRRAYELAGYDNIILLCGHYEGVDERILEEIVDEELSIGDYVLTGGELPACVTVDCISRMLPGVLANEDCWRGESIASGMLEYPQYTRPVEFHGRRVPDVLLSGHHENIDRWRRSAALELTRKIRPELLEGKGVGVDSFEPAPKGSGVGTDTDSAVSEEA